MCLVGPNFLDKLFHYVPYGGKVSISKLEKNLPQRMTRQKKIKSQPNFLCLLSLSSSAFLPTFLQIYPRSTLRSQAHNS